MQFRTSMGVRAYRYADVPPCGAGAVVVADDDLAATSADAYAQGYAIGRLALRGDRPAHPANSPFPEHFFHGMRAGLAGRGLDRSMFGVVIAAS